MKKEYIKPIVTEVIALGDEMVLAVHSYDHADSKDNNLVFEEDYDDDAEGDNNGWGAGW